MSLILVIAAAAASPGERSEPAASVEQPIDRQQIEAWIRDLNADVFVERELATENLVRAGVAAIDPLRAALANSNLEVATRAVFVLREMALSGDLPTEEAARAALQQVATVGAPPAQRRAAASLAVLDTIRQERALEHLQRLGAQVSVWQGFIGGQFEDHLLVIEFDQQWTGAVHDLGELRWLRDIERVSFSGERVTDEWLEPVQHLTDLRSVHVKRTKVTDAALAHLAPLAKLDEIIMWYSPIGDEAVEHLQRHQTALDIELYGTAMRPEAAAALERILGQRNVVDYRRGGFLGVGCSPHPLGCEVSLVHPNSGAAQAGVKERDLLVRYNGKPVGDFEALKELISSDEVGAQVTMQLYRGGDYVPKSFAYQEGDQLGLLAGTAHTFGCEVERVARESILDRLNIRPGDCIVRYQDTGVTGPQDLQALFQQSAAGDHVTLHLLRDGQLIKTVATLGEWP